MLETEDVKCKTGSLRIIKEITTHPEIRRAVTLMGGVEVKPYMILFSGIHIFKILSFIMGIRNGFVITIVDDTNTIEQKSATPVVSVRVDIQFS